MPAFDFFVVGCGGGANETNLSGYLLKAHESSWAEGIIAVEAGSGFGALKRILHEKPQLFASVAGEPAPDAARVYSYVRTYLITHAHLDHVQSLVLLAGSAGGPRKSIRGSQQCLEDLQTIFKPSRIWPNLASWDPDDSDHLYLYHSLPEDDVVYTPLHGTLSVRMLPLSHGAAYASAAFFVRHGPSARELLFLGDVEPDALAVHPRTAAVWRAAAPKIPHVLDTLFVECSWPAGRADDKLYGHLTPAHLLVELENLAAAVVRCRPESGLGESAAPLGVGSKPGASASSSRKRASSIASPERKRQKRTPGAADLRGVLMGVTVYIMHCKEDMEGRYTRPMHEVITEQVRQLMDEKGLGATILAAEQGALIRT
ncbi:cAMP phosphodiesterases class-II-domain-containing protein [Phellopilus nigrolimitatus]|nr:cAMP phosphodiesterases class-II-domain-containing protein [Phellopilus nigrolimitatus]